MNRHFFYSIGTDANLYMTSWGPDSGNPAAPTQVGTAWAGARHIFSGGERIVYMVDSEGQLRWYRHDNQGSAGESWSGGDVLAPGWGAFSHVAAAGNGIIYAIHSVTGDLYRYNHTGWRTGAAEFEDWYPSPIGNGWGGFRHLLAWGERHIYAINEAGDVLYYSYEGGWSIGARPAGGSFGGFSDVFIANGTIFGVTPTHIYWFGTNADGTVYNAGSMLNPDPTKTRWLGCYTAPPSYWWEGKTVNFRLEKHPSQLGSPDGTVWYFYLLAHYSGAFTGDAESPTTGTAFRLEVVDRIGYQEARVRLRTYTNKYLIALDGGGVMANSDNPGAWETWLVRGSGVEQAGGFVSLESWRNRWLRQDLIFNTTAIGVEFRSTPAVPMADALQPYVPPEFHVSAGSSFFAWNIHQQ